MYKVKTKKDLESFMTDHWDQINIYIDHITGDLPIPIYSSVDIREGRTKFAPVDHNIYPAGFNNLCALDLGECSNAFRRIFEKMDQKNATIGIIPESHTKNTFYLDHLVFLGKCLKDAGHDIHYISFDKGLFPSGKTTLSLVSHSKFPLQIHLATIQEGEVVGGFSKIDLLILNNDQSHPLTVDWSELKTPIMPTPKIGWFKRQKAKHFLHYQRVIDTFCHEFSINPNLLMAKFKSEENIDFSTQEGIKRIGQKVDELIAELGSDSSVFVKAGQGTYGMGISVVKSGEDIVNMNRKMRNKMDTGKNKKKFNSVVIQECVETILVYDGMPSEVSIYLVEGKAKGGFMRVNPKKDACSNLNSQGTIFKKYCISEIRQHGDHQSKEATYAIIARLVTLASAYEIAEVL